MPASIRRIEVAFTHAFSPVQSTIINSSLREMPKNLDFNVRTQRWTISRETPMTESYFESKDLLNDIGFLKRKWSVSEVLVKQHNIDKLEVRATA